MTKLTTDNPPAIPTSAAEPAAASPQPEPAKTVRVRVPQRDGDITLSVDGAEKTAHPVREHIVECPPAFARVLVATIDGAQLL